MGSRWRGERGVTTGNGVSSGLLRDLDVTLQAMEASGMASLDLRVPRRIRNSDQSTHSKAILE